MSSDFALAFAELEKIRDGLTVGLQTRVVLPGLDEARLDLVEKGVDHLVAVLLPGRHGLGDERQDALPLKPSRGRRVLTLGQSVEKMPVEMFDARLVEAAHHRQEARLVRRDSEVGDAEQERLVAFVGAAVDQVGGLGVGTRDDDPWHSHDVELEAGGVESLDLLVRRDEHLAALMAAFLGTWTLVFDVVAGHASLDEAADQVAHVWISTVSGVGVGDDERPEVDCRSGCALLVGHPQTQVLLVAVSGQQRAHQTRRPRREPGSADSSRDRGPGPRSSIPSPTSPTRRGRSPRCPSSSS